MFRFATVTCDAGFGGDGNICTRCSRGLYKSNVGNEACSNCPIGYTTKMEGAYYEEQCCEYIRSQFCPYNYFLCPFHIFCDFSFQLLVLLGRQSLMAFVSNVKQEL